jgi:uncharacterized protein (TIGR04255 family)
MPKYKRNFLHKVIARIDFQQIIGIRNSLSKELSKKALEIFPIEEPKKKLVGVKFQLSAKEVKREELGEKVEWHYHGRNREKSLCIASDFMYISYSIYENIEKLSAEFFTILEQLIKSYRDIQVTRTGLRYINNIELNEGNHIEWHRYLNDDLLSIFDVALDKTKISRAFQILELNYGDMNLKFQYGMFNPDFPAPIRKKIFMLDYDAFFQGLQSENEIKDNIIKFNNEIEKLFESCIKDGLREVMNGN